MKTLIFSSAIALMMTLNLAAAPDGTKVSSSTKVEIFQTNPESVDVYVAKNAGELVKINIYSESGTRLMTTRVKKQSARYIRYHLNELPEGAYKVCVEKDDKTISSLEISK
jgi:hypothetical protein